MTDHLNRIQDTCDRISWMVQRPLPGGEQMTETRIECAITAAVSLRDEKSCGRSGDGN